MDIPQELYAHEVIRYLPVEDILNLCETNLSFKKICNDPATWQYLIDRDFKGEVVPGKDPKSQYLYAKYIHDMSDIHFTERSLPPLRLLGYTRRNEVFILNEMNPERIYGNLLSYYVNPRNQPWYKGWVSLQSFTKSLFEKNQWEWREVLPSIFTIVELGGIVYIGMDIYHLAQIYDYYHGRDSFWKGFVTYIQPYLTSLSSDQLEDVEEWIKTLYDMVYP